MICTRLLFNCIAFFALSASLWSCAEALPRELPNKEVGDALIRAERAAQEATKAAQQAKAEADRNAQLLAEARDLGLRAESARQQCQQNYQRMVGIEEARKKAQRAQVVKIKKAEEAAAIATPTPTPEPPKVNDPDYSPSDAPLNPAH